MSFGLPRESACLIAISQRLATLTNTSFAGSAINSAAMAGSLASSAIAKSAMCVSSNNLNRRFWFW
jgi:hypothetical protein